MASIYNIFQHIENKDYKVWLFRMGLHGTLKGTGITNAQLDAIKFTATSPKIHLLQSQGGASLNHHILWVKKIHFEIYKNMYVPTDLLETDD